MSFQLCGEQVEFYFPEPTPSPLFDTPSPTAALVHTVLPDAAPDIAAFDGDGGLRMWSIALHNIPPLTLTGIGVTSAYTGEVVDPISPFHTSTSTPPMSSPCTIWS